jgi:hypothetical protein
LHTCDKSCYATTGDLQIFGWRFGLVTGDFFIDVFDACFYC